MNNLKKAACLIIAASMTLTAGCTNEWSSLPEESITQNSSTSGTTSSASEPQSSIEQEIVSSEEESDSEETIETNEYEYEEIKAAEPLSFEGASPEDSDLYAAPIEGMTDDFIKGADVSSDLSEIESGVVFKDFEGNTLDGDGFFKLLAQCGVNCVRIRVWNDPNDSEGKTYGGGHNDLETAVQIGRLATKAGLGVLIDFHYSDFWADPAKQKAPKEWAHLTFDDKKQKLYEFTKDSVKTLLDAGVNVTMVQTGNEINNGMAGENDRTKVNELLIEGGKAVKEAAAEYNKDIRVVLHYTNPLESTLLEIAEDLKTQNVDYDVFAVSFYTYWHGEPKALTEQLKKIADTYGKEVMVAETSYLYTPEDGDGHANTVSADSTGVTMAYDISVQGQANEVRSVMQAVKNVGGAGIGVFYWEPAWIPVQVYDPSGPDAETVLENNRAIWEERGSGWASSATVTYDPNDAGKYYGGCAWDNQAMFDFEGNPLESLKIFRFVFGGTNAELKTVSVNDISLESGICAELNLPETVPALMNSGETSEIPVVWNEADKTAADVNTAGIYEIRGKALSDGKNYNVKCSVEIKKINYIKNPGFEDIDMSMWTISGNGVSREADNNKRSGEYSLKFWDDKQVTYTAEQKITGIPAGTYELGAYLQGGDAGSNPIFELYITVNGETFKASSKVTAWQEWDNPVVSGIVIPENAEVTVGVKCDAAAGAWGAWDDFYLQLEG